ncbi:MAG: WD40 repeat domain-containing protein [Phaeodactylibacter sp.]|nr:WD40 repeat domain-containing protein [Phaeodactylibacter sp.]MCB9276653.1 WD40 repeat domain-containing protein [Lewinellaceae bacterium]
MIKARKAARMAGHEAAVYALCAAETPRFVLSGAGDGWIARWDLENPETGRLIAKVGSQAFSLLYLPGQHTVVAGNMNGGVHWIPLNDTKEGKNIAHHKKGAYAIIEVEGHVFTAGGEGAITRWAPDKGQSLESFHLSNQSLRCLAYCPQRREIAAGASDNAIYLIDADTLALRHRLPGAHDNSVFALHYTPSGDKLLSGGRDARLKAWSLGAEPRLLHSQPAHWYTINSIAFHPRGPWFATASRDRTVKLWDADTFNLLKVLDATRDGGHINSVNKLLWSSHNDMLISASDDRTLIAWEVEGLSG